MIINTFFIRHIHYSCANTTFASFFAIFIIINYQSILPLLYKSSNGLAMFTNALLLTCKYLSVVFILKCPSKSFIYLISVPFSKRCVAKLCLKLCTPTSFLSLLFLWLIEILVARLLLQRVSFSPQHLFINPSNGKIYSSAYQPQIYPIVKLSNCRIINCFPRFAISVPCSEISAFKCKRIYIPELKIK